VGKGISNGREVNHGDDSSLIERCGTKVARPVVLLTVVAVWALAGGAAADEIVLPSAPVERGQLVKLAYQLDRPVSGRGTLDLGWRDANGREVERRRLDFALDQAAEIPFAIDTRRAVTTRNILSARIVFADAPVARDPDEHVAHAELILPPAGSRWADYQIIMWQGYPSGSYPRLKEIGISAGMSHADRSRPEHLVEHEIEPLLRNDLPWYVENIATDFYSEYHRWRPDHPVNWRFTETQRLYQLNPNDPTVLQRSPSLSDPGWLQRIHDRVVATVGVNRRYRPLFYNLADEPGIADLLLFWDFDFSEPSLAGFRQWLRRIYPTLEALNRQWGSAFAAWDEIVPMTTPEAMRRADGNLSGWADFKEWMDVAFAAAFRMGRDAVHEADPDALAGLEGGQSIGWGGWNYAHLAGAVDLMEIYDDGSGNLDLVRSLNPAAVLLTTSFGQGPAEERRVWREWLRGTRGLVIWDEKKGYVGDDEVIAARGREAMPYYGALRGGLGAQLIQSRRRFDPVAILYSPASLRVRWLLDWQKKGDGWTRLDPDGAAAENGPRQASMRGFLRAVELAGLTPRLLSPQVLSSGALERDGTRVLILPQAVALSAGEIAAIRRFAERGGTIITDGEPGQFDGHGRPLDAPALGDLFAPGTSAVAWTPPNTLAQSGAAPDREAVGMLRGLLAAGGVVPGVLLTAVDGAPVSDVARYVFADGDVTLVGLQRDGASAATGEVVLNLRKPSYVYDLRSRHALGRLDHLRLSLDAVAPTVLAVAPRPLPAPTIAGPSSLRLGALGEFRLALVEGGDAAPHVFHVDVIDPAGSVVAHYSGNLVAPSGDAAHILPLALNDPPGTWQIHVIDVLSGQSATATVRVEP
jgi:hypothetical protein